MFLDGADPSPFADLPFGAIHVDAAAYLSDLGIVNGTGPATFDPQAATTRGQVAAMLARTLHLDVDDDADGELVFTDTAGTTHADAIDRLHAHGIARGYTDRTYRPNAIITRAAFATTLDRALPDLQP